jgi:uncharacterized membrane protein YedE/YeeE
MSIDWNHFTPIPALVGGLIIGLAAAVFILLNGQIAGISGIVGGLLRPKHEDIGWRVAFIVGLITAPIFYRFIAVLPESHITENSTLIAMAGLFVGLGARYGSGCTSGHGVCGLSRLSRRSLVATLVFMSAGFITVFIIRHLLKV